MVNPLAHCLIKAGQASKLCWASLVIPTLTFASSYGVSFGLHLVPLNELPLISKTGRYPPASCLFSLGLALTAAILCLCSYLISYSFEAKLFSPGGANTAPNATVGPQESPGMYPSLHPSEDPSALTESYRHLHDNDDPVSSKMVHMRARALKLCRAAAVVAALACVCLAGVGSFQDLPLTRIPHDLFAISFFTLGLVFMALVTHLTRVTPSLAAGGGPRGAALMDGGAEDDVEAQMKNPLRSESQIQAARTPTQASRRPAFVVRLVITILMAVSALLVLPLYHLGFHQIGAVFEILATFCILMFFATFAADPTLKDIGVAVYVAR